MEPSDTPHADRLGDDLIEAAADIDVSDTSTALQSVQHESRRRRRRRTTFVGLMACLALVAGGVVAVGLVRDDGGTDSLSIAGPEETDPPVTDPPVTDPVTGTASDAASGAPADAPAPADPAPDEATAPLVGAVTVEVVDGATARASVPSPGDAAEGFVEWLVPWDDGFLAGRRSFTPQALPEELPEEIVALFPPEVVEFFDGELPPTITEATQMLSEAGLLEAVTQVLADNPEASDAIYSQPVPESTFEVSFTTDGSEWQSVPFELPDGIGDVQAVRVGGERLVVMSQVHPDFAAGGEDPFSQPDQAGRIYVSSTTDLSTWDVIEVPVDDRPADLPDVLVYGVYAQGLAASPNGWTLGVSSNLDINVGRALELVPPEVADRFATDGGYSYGYDDDGLFLSFDRSVTVFSESGEPVATTPPPDGQTDYTVSWEELGVDPAAVPTTFDGGELVTWAGTWGADPVPTEARNLYRVVGSNDGFYGTDGALSYSPDGIAWSDLELPADSWSIGSIMPLTDGVAVVVESPSGSEIYRVRGAAGTWELLDVPGAPDALSMVFGESGAWLVDGSERAVPEPTTVVIDVDGFTLTMTNGPAGSVSTLVDAAGTIVAEETLNPRSGDQPEVFQYGQLGIDVIDTATDDVIVSIPNSVLAAAYQEQVPQPDFEEEFQPDVWLLASADGDTWLVDHIGTSSDVEFYGPGASATNGNVVLVATGAEWTRYEI